MTKPVQQAKVYDSVYPMWQAARLAEEMVQDTLNPEMRSIFTTGLPFVDKVLNPRVAGNLITTLGRPSNGKTLWSNYLLLQMMNKMKAENRPPNEICVLVTTEDSIEVTALTWLSRLSKIPMNRILRGEITPQELAKISASVYQVMDLPFFIIGISSKRNEQNKRELPNLSPQTITNALDYIVNEYKNKETGQRYEVKFLVTDYLQNLTIPPGIDERRFYVETMAWAKATAYHIGGVHNLNVQARREVDDREIKLPGKRDGAETAAIEHKSQVMFSLMLPASYLISVMPAIKQGKIDIPEIPVQDNLIYLSLIKQQNGPSNFIWPCLIDFETLTLHEHPLMSGKY